jgi:hypothetical protein
MFFQQPLAPFVYLAESNGPHSYPFQGQGETAYTREEISNLHVRSASRASPAPKIFNQSVQQTGKPAAADLDRGIARKIFFVIRHFFRF